MLASLRFCVRRPSSWALRTVFSNAKVEEALSENPKKLHPFLYHRLKAAPDTSAWTPDHVFPTELPFFIGRTKTNHLPVYTTIKSGGTRKMTHIRRIHGSAEALKKLLSFDIFGPHVEITVRPGRVEFKGHHANTVKTWLEKLGF